jgi:hypothetical protein
MDWLAAVSWPAWSRIICTDLRRKSCLNCTCGCFIVEPNVQEKNDLHKQTGKMKPCESEKELFMKVES